MFKINLLPINTYICLITEHYQLLLLSKIDIIIYLLCLILSIIRFLRKQQKFTGNQILKETIRAMPLSVFHLPTGCWESKPGLHTLPKYYLMLPLSQTIFSLMQHWPAPLTKFINSDGLAYFCKLFYIVF